MGAVSHILESHGVATTGISLVREQTAAMRLPRFLWVPFELGRPFGAPNEPAFQRRVLLAALELLERTDGPVLLADFPDDAPASDDEHAWACPVSFAPKPSEEPALVQETLAEIARLAPWIDAAPGRLRCNSGMAPDDIAPYLGRLSEGLPVDDTLNGRPLVEVTRLACDDLRSYYLRAARQQPGQATTSELEDWFWQHTAAGRLLDAVADRLRHHPDLIVRGFAARALVPRGQRSTLPHPVAQQEMTMAKAPTPRPAVEREIVREPLTGPAAWRGPDLAPKDWCHLLDTAEVAALEQLKDDLVRRDVRLAAIDPDSTPIPELASSVASWVERVEHGIGFVVVRGLDINGWSVRETGLVYYALGRQMGRPVRQNALGHLLGHVQDTGRDIFTDPGTRGYQTRISLPYHTDTSTDVLGLLCFRPAKSGGTSSLAPLQSIYNEVLRQRPDLIDTFYEPFHFDCRGEEHPDGGPFYSRVLASMHAGQMSLRHNSGYARSSARFAECPPLTENQSELLALIDALAEREDVHFDVTLEQGDMIFINNYAVMHSRTEFEDHEDPDRRRHLLRLWLVLYGGRALAPDFDNRAGLLTTADVRDDGLGRS